MKRNRMIRVFIIFLFVLIFTMTLGYASFNKTFAISESVTHIRTDKKIRITNLLVDSATNHALANSEEYDYNMLSLDFDLPNRDSSLTYAITVSNIGNMEMIISDIYLNNTYKDVFNIEISNYTLGEILKDDDHSCVSSSNGCKLGISRTIYITISYQDNVYDTVEKYNFNNVVINFEYVSNETLKIGENILDLNQIESNTYILNDGSLTSYNGWDTSGYIDISGYSKIIIVSDTTSFLSNYNAFYDENMNFIKTVNLGKTKINNNVLGDISASMNILKLNGNEKYLRISGDSNAIKHIKIYPVENEDFYNKLLFNITKEVNGEYQFGNNILTNEKIISNTYISASDGSQIAYNSWNSTDYLYVGDYESIVIYSDESFSLTSYNAMYDSNKNYVKSFGNITTSKYYLGIGYYLVIAKPANVDYIRLSATSSLINRLTVTTYAEKNYELDDSNIQNLNLGESIFNTNMVVPNSYISNGNGELIDYDGWTSTDYIQTDIYNGIFVIGSSGNYNAIYASNKNFSHNFTCDNYTLNNEILGDVGVGLCFIAQNNQNSYLRFSSVSSSINNLKLYPVLNEDFNRHLIFTVK